MTKSKIIFTADDYGVDDSINDGIIDLVKADIIRSVEVLPNYGDGGELSIKSTLRLLDETAGFNPHLELGVHFTITSGKPLKRTTGLEAILCNGHFITAKQTNSGATTSAIYDELMLQADVLLNHPRIGTKITHLTNHHDALWFFPEYTDAYERVANKLNLPIRNSQVEPESSEALYYKLGGLRSASRADKKKSKEAYQLREDGKFEIRELNYRSTNYLDGSYYNLFKALLKSDPYSPDKLIKNRIKQLREIFGRVRDFQQQDHSKQLLVEVLLHVRKGSLANSEVRLSDEFRKQMGEDAFDEFDLSTYNGITTKYFDGRSTEYTSLVWAKQSGLLQELFDAHDVEWGRWSDCFAHRLEKG